MKEKQSLVIILPERLADLPIQIIRSSNHEQLLFGIHSEEGSNMNYANRFERKYVFIWQQNDYLKVSLDEILWIEADRSYSKIHLSKDRNMIISFNLAVMEHKLPDTDFMRIHRSCIVNLRHVVSLTGNSLRICGNLLTIGREYRENLLDRFIFLGVRRGGLK